MTRICNYLIGLVLLFPRIAFASGGTEVVVSGFLAQHSFQLAKSIQRCSKEISLFANSAFLFAEYRSNETPKNSVEIKALCAKTRRCLYDGLYTLASENFMYELEAGCRAFYNIAGKKASFLKGMEFVTSGKSGTHIVYTLPLKNSLPLAERLLGSESFKSLYGAELLKDSRKALDKKNIGEAVQKLNKAEANKNFTVEENLFKTKVLHMAGRIAEAQKTAEDLFLHARELSAESVEKLGDLFLEMGNENKANKAYDFALEKLK